MLRRSEYKCTCSLHIAEVQRGEHIYHMADSIFAWQASIVFVNLVITGSTVDTVSKGYFIVGMTVVAGILLLISFISVTVAVLVTRHCYKDSDKSPSSSLSKSAAMQDSTQGQKINEDVAMTENPAYGPVDSTQERELVSVYEGNSIQRVYEDIPMTDNPAY